MFKKARGRADGNVAPPTQTVQCDWEQRDFTQSITLGLSQLTDFLNNFGATRAKAQLQPKPTLPVGGAGLHGLQPHRVAFNPPFCHAADVKMRGRLAQLNSRPAAHTVHAHMGRVRSSQVRGTSHDMCHAPRCVAELARWRVRCS